MEDGATEAGLGFLLTDAVERALWEESATDIGFAFLVTEANE